MRYELKNLGPGAWYSVEAGKLLQPGDAVKVNRIDDGTRRLGEGPKPRLAITDLTTAPPAAAPAGTSPSTPAAPPVPAAPDRPSPETKLKPSAKAAPDRTPAPPPVADKPAPAPAPADRADAPRSA